MPSTLGYLILLLGGVVLQPGAKGRALIGGARWIPGLLSLLALVVAGEQIVLGIRASGVGGLRLVGVPLSGLVLAGLLGRWIPIQGWLNARVGSAAAKLGDPSPMRAGEGVGVVLVLLGLNPIGWLAAFVAGAGGDWRPLAWKGALDVVTLLTLSKGSRGVLFWGSVLTAGVHLVFEWAGGWVRGGLERADVAGVCLVTSGLVWLVVPMMVLRVRKVPLGVMVLSVPATIGVGWIWR